MSRRRLVKAELKGRKLVSVNRIEERFHGFLDDVETLTILTNAKDRHLAREARTRLRDLRKRLDRASSNFIPEDEVLNAAEGLVAASLELYR